MDRWMNGWTWYKWISEQYIFIAPYSLKEDIGLVAIKALLQSIYHFITIIIIIIIIIIINIYFITALNNLN